MSETQPAAQCCANCWYSAPAVMEGDGAPVMQCRRYPPRLVVYDGEVQQCQVQVDGEDWCGEWHRPIGVTPYVKRDASA